MSNCGSKKRVAAVEKFQRRREGTTSSRCRLGNATTQTMAERGRVVSLDDDGREEFNAQKGTAAARRRPRRSEGARTRSQPQRSRGRRGCAGCARGSSDEAELGLSWAGIGCARTSWARGGGGPARLGRSSPAEGSARGRRGAGAGGRTAQGARELERRRGLREGDARGQGRAGLGSVSRGDARRRWAWSPALGGEVRQSERE